MCSMTVALNCKVINKVQLRYYLKKRQFRWPENPRSSSAFFFMYNIYIENILSLVEDIFIRRVPFTFLGFMLQQDPVSTMQKTGWAIHSSFSVLSGLERVSFWMWSLGGVNNHFPVYWAIFGVVTNEQTNNQVILVQACSWPVRRQSFAINSTKHQYFD